MKVLYKNPYGEESVVFETGPMPEKRFRRLCCVLEIVSVSATALAAMAFGDGILSVIILVVVAGCLVLIKEP